jgi:hypothetical protein
MVANKKPQVQGVGIFPLIPVVVLGATALGSAWFGYEVGKPDVGPDGKPLPNALTQAATAVGTGVGKGIQGSMIIIAALAASYFIFTRERRKSK